MIAWIVYATVDAGSSTGLPDQPTTRVLAASSAPSVSANGESGFIVVTAAAAQALLQPRSWSTVKAGTAVTINAILQPTMSQTTYYMPNGDQPKPGLVAIASPAPTNAIRFYDGLRLVGTATFGANGTLATVRLDNLASGLHLFSAQYPTDIYYDQLTFGLVAIYVTP
jgi:hypothetical protein